MEKWTISAIKQANEAAGGVFFDKSHLKHSKTLPKVYEGPGGVAFLTSSRDETVDGPEWSVWSFNPDTAAIRMISRGNMVNDLVVAAKAYAAGTTA